MAAKFAGHSIHPILIVFPLGLLATSVGFDIAYLVNANPNFPIVSYWMLAVGTTSGLVAALFGFLDWWGVPKGTRAYSVGFTHAIVNMLAILLFIGSCLMRYDVPGYAPSNAAITLSFFAAALAIVGGWLGGELVERLGLAVHEGAHMNAVSSLTGHPASESAQDHAMGRHKQPSQA